jgi:hypothetical protein
MPRGVSIMFDLSQPVPTSVIVGSITFIFVLVGIGLGVVKYYKKKMGL